MSGPHQVKKSSGRPSSLQENRAAPSDSSGFRFGFMLGTVGRVSLVKTSSTHVSILGVFPSVSLFVRDSTFFEFGTFSRSNPRYEWHIQTRLATPEGVF